MFTRAVLSLSLPLSLPLFFPSTACTESGRVFVFGRNKYGEVGLGHGSSQSVAVPTPIHSLSGIVKVACGLYHSAAIDGELTHYVHVHVFFVCVQRKVVVLGIVNILTLLANFSEDGILWMWGWGSRGQLGQGELKNLNTPTKVEGFK